MKEEEFLGQEHHWKWYQNIGGTEEFGRETYFKITSINDGNPTIFAIDILLNVTASTPNTVLI